MTEDQMDADPLDDGLDWTVGIIRRVAVGLLCFSAGGLIVLALCGRDVCKWAL